MFALTPAPLPRERERGVDVAGSAPPPLAPGGNLKFKISDLRAKATLDLPQGVDSGFACIFIYIPASFLQFL
jgi:hypothetical protein